MRPRPARIVVSTAGLLVLAGLGAATISAADPRPGQVNAGAIGGRFISCSGAVAGVRVSIEGRAHSALSGPTGAFELNDLPPGTFVVTVEAQGERATIARVQVLSGQMTDVGEINLTDRGTDAKHCGMCGKRCPPGASCVYGVCICPDEAIVCGDTCTALADLEHCLACWNRCAAFPSMIPQCGEKDCLFQCVDGTADCDGRRLNGCETRIDSDARNCGACGHVCAPGQRCVESRCQ
ncbi:MAG: hypothetical protein DMD82_05155 [Candidatus Rokuibacteriota bacterium]|nr:MAG: hypothetical protein DMD82_05155 [Candidatus Rokubacteria bacterium]